MKNAAHACQFVDFVTVINRGYLWAVVSCLLPGIFYGHARTVCNILCQRKDSVW